MTARPAMYLILSGLLIPACSTNNQNFDPKTLPYTLETATDFGGDHILPVDLNGDGQDEIVRRQIPSESTSEGDMNAIWIRTLEGEQIEQINYEGKTLSPSALDLDGDNVVEILVPFIRRDSLFLSILDTKGVKLSGFFLIDGKPRIDPDGSVFKWEQRDLKFFAFDLDTDGETELVTVLDTRYAGHPRGILVHTLSDGEHQSQHLIGALPIYSHFGDFDGDSKPEILLSTWATDNGASAGGFDDLHSYILSISLEPDPVVEWSREAGGKGSMVASFYDDFNRDGSSEFLFIKAARDAKNEASEFELVEPGSWQTLKKRVLDERLISPQIIDLDRDGTFEIIAIRSPGELWVFNSNFDVIARESIAPTLTHLTTWPDADGDGIGEIAVVARDRLLLLGPDLQAKASYTWSIVLGLINRGLGFTPYLLLEGVDKTVAMTLVKNRYYLFYRYGPASLWILGIGLVIGGGTYIFRLNRRSDVLKHVQVLLLEDNTQLWLLISPAGRVEGMSAGMCQLLNLKFNEAPKRSFGEVFKATPALVTFLQDLQLLLPPHHVEKHLQMDSDSMPLFLAAEPLTYGSKRHYWLIKARDSSRELHNQHQAWAMMAQRIAHDIKNPLTSILLTLQRLQMEYNERAPDAAASFDIYSHRIIERIEHLRRMTRNFMKFVDLEDPTLAATNLSSFVKKQAATIRSGLPPDIELALKLQDDLPSVMVDQEQLFSAIENLIANAVNAMQDGGMITIITGLAQTLQFNGEEKPGDYVILEVQDTGAGISAIVRAKLFDPGFTTSGGTGLGLTLVKKIINDHKGHIELESEPNSGSSFSLYLPVNNY